MSFVNKAKKCQNKHSMQLWDALRSHNMFSVAYIFLKCYVLPKSQSRYLKARQTSGFAPFGRLLRGVSQSCSRPFIKYTQHISAHCSSLGTVGQVPAHLWKNCSVHVCKATWSNITIGSVSKCNYSKDAHNWCVQKFAVLTVLTHETQNNHLKVLDNRYLARCRRQTVE